MIGAHRPSLTLDETTMSVPPVGQRLPLLYYTGISPGRVTTGPVFGASGDALRLTTPASLAIEAPE